MKPFTFLIVLVLLTSSTYGQSTTPSFTEEALKKEIDRNLNTPSTAEGTLTLRSKTNSKGVTYSGAYFSTPWTKALAEQLANGAIQNTKDLFDEAFLIDANGNVPNGEGTIQFSDGIVKGTFVNGWLHGMGEQEYNHEHKDHPYIRENQSGDYQYNLLNGKGQLTFVFRNGNTVYYRGNFIDALEDGKIIMETHYVNAEKDGDPYKLVATFDFKMGNGDGLMKLTRYYKNHPEVFEMGITESDKKIGEWVGHTIVKGKKVYFKLEYQDDEMVSSPSQIEELDYKLKAYDIQMKGFTYQE
ncbi:MAG: hypothetical protein AAF598_04660 [Bacteroidota bacterium]